MPPARDRLTHNCLAELRMVLGLLASLILAVGIGIAPATADDIAKPSPTTLRIATKIVPPFVMRQGNAPASGFSIDLMKAIARDLKLKVEFDFKPDMPQLLQAIATGQDDAAIGAISITEAREELYDFSQPIFNGGFQIAIPVNNSTTNALTDLGRILFSWGALEILVGVIVIAVLPVPFVWFFEWRAGSELFDAKSWFGQFAQSVWWSICALTTQAQDMPSSLGGRMIAVVWMLFAIVFTSFFTASVTSRLTVDQLENTVSGLHDLPGKVVETVVGSTADAYLRDRDIRTIQVASIDKAVEDLAGERAQAIVYDAPTLAYLANHEDKGKFQLVGPILRPESYGIAFPLNSPLRKQMNEAILRIVERGEYQLIHDNWFADGTNSAKSNP